MKINKDILKKFLYGITILISLIIITGFFVKPAEGVGLLAQYTGGEIKSVRYCPCAYDFGVVLEIKQPWDNQTIKLFFSPLYSSLYADYNPWESGPNVIVSYTKGSHDCQRQKGYYCTKSGQSADGTINMIGTSLK